MTGDRRPAPDDPPTLRELAAAAAAALAERTGVESHDVAIVLGSGWVPAIDALGPADAELAVTELPGFLPPAVEGHAGRIRSLTSAASGCWPSSAAPTSTRAAASRPVVHGVRVAAAAGCRTSC